MFHTITELFSQKKCFGCQASGHFFCPLCVKNLTVYTPYCYVCKQPSSNFLIHENCHSAFPYCNKIIVLTRYHTSSIRRLLKSAKYYNRFQAYEDIIAPKSNFFRENIDTTQRNILVPIPIHWTRKWKRGYNQSEKIAGVLSNILYIPIHTELVKKYRPSKQQARLSQSDRKRNLRGSFKVLKNTTSKDEHIYLVDDIVSTGSTIHEVSKVLHDAGYTNISAIVIASD